MVSFSEVHSSNTKILSSLPSGLVGVFVGATGGIGYYTLKAFVKHAKAPKVIFVGRNRDAAERILRECRELNSEGGFEFLQADTSLVRNTDRLCEEIKGKVDHINLLVLSTGCLNFTDETPEHLSRIMALNHYTRYLIMSTLLPLLRRAPSLRRVVTIFTGTKEGYLNPSDLAGRKVGFASARGHGASLVTLSLEALAKEAPEVGFIHAFPGSVKTGLGQNEKGIFLAIARAVTALLLLVSPGLFVKEDESGERHLWVGTSGRFGGREGSKGTNGLALEQGEEVAVDTNGQRGSGVYVVDEKGEVGGEKVLELLAGMRKKGMVEQVQEHTQGEIRRARAVIF